MSNYTPDRWVVLEVFNGTVFTNKVFAGWYGGYLDGDSWRMNSGNDKEEEFSDRWVFTGASGSKYVCYKERYGMSAYMDSVLADFKANLPEGSLVILENYSV